MLVGNTTHRCGGFKNIVPNGLRIKNRFNVFYTLLAVVRIINN